MKSLSLVCSGCHGWLVVSTRLALFIFTRRCEENLLEVIMFSMGDLVKFKSEAHRRKCHKLVQEGKMSKETLELMEKNYVPKTLPERAPSRVSATRGTKRTTKVQK